MDLAKKIEDSFNNKDLNLHVSCYTDDTEAFNLENEKTEFTGSNDLGNLIKELFRINPNLKCKIKHSVQHDPFLTLHLYFWDYVCGKTLDTVWNCKIENGKIKKVWFTK